MYWAKYHIAHLRRWREAAKTVARAVEALGLKARVYVIGGAAEGRLTVLSDVDILVCLEEELDPRRVKHMVLEEAFNRQGLPDDYPLQLHVHTARECKNLLTRYKSIPVDKL